MHTELSLSHMDKACQQLGHVLRKLGQQTAGAYNTLELPREYSARQRRMQAGDPLKNKQSSAPKAKGLNLKTYKFHAIGDYGQSIVQFGTVDSYSTQIVSYAA
jgi:hypothetical protein